MQIFDSHCHLDFDYAPLTAEDLIRNASAAGVTHLMTVSTEPKNFEFHQKISENHPQVYHSIGIHPHESVLVRDEDLATIEKMSTHPKCRAIGEIGLDYYYKHSEPLVQQKRIQDQLAIARKRSLPVVIHARDAETDLDRILSEHVSLTGSTKIPGVIHCFTGTLEFARRCVDLGFMISFSGILTFKNSQDLRATAEHIPLDRIMVETDSPFLAPVPMRGKKCEPAMIVHTAKVLGDLHKKSLNEIAAITFKNTLNVFSI